MEWTKEKTRKRAGHGRSKSHFRTRLRPEDCRILAFTILIFFLATALLTLTWRELVKEKLQLRVLCSLPHKLLRSVRNRTLQCDLGTRLLSFVVGRVLSASESSIGVLTQGNAEITAWCSDGVKYEPTPYHVLPAILRHISSDDVFVDLGCGKGRVPLFVATRRRLKKVVGIEIDPQLAQIARENMAKCGPITPVSIVEADVLEVDLSEGSVFFLFNPFGEKTLRKVLENIRNSLRRHPRNIRILYLNPKHAHALDDAAWLRPTKNNAAAFLAKEFRVWRNQIWTSPHEH
jgi:SAM-dependent methyltransferase